MSKQKGYLAKFSLITLIAVYFLILVGGIVRSTGSGMGCPDWPKCFGNWVPPTEVSQLPDNYKEVYSQKRAEKNKKFAVYLSALGFDKTAEKIQNDESILIEADFNKYKTWTEYINRLVGALIGLLILITFLLSIKYLKTNKTIFFVALATLILVIFQGWIGSIVVSTNLVPWTITLHMLIALLIVALLIYLVYKTNADLNIPREVSHRKYFVGVIIVCMLVMLIQVVLGTQVREEVDHIAGVMNNSARDSWIANLGVNFVVHRSFSWVVVGVHVVLLIMAMQGGIRSTLINALLIIIGISVLSGVAMAYFGIPPVLQPVHLLLGTAAFGVQFMLLLQFMNKKNVEEVRA